MFVINLRSTFAPAPGLAVCLSDIHNLSNLEYIVYNKPFVMAVSERVEETDERITSR